MFTKGQGSEVIYGVADYWVSRVTWSPEDQKYHLLGKDRYQKEGHYTEFMQLYVVIRLISAQLKTT